MRDLARSLITAERRESDPTETDVRAAFRVCEKLRQSLSILTGAAGFRSLLMRALALATLEVPSLAQVKVGPTGTLSVPDAFDQAPRESEAARDGAALVARLLELLATFIGEALTRRLVQQSWPTITLDAPKPGGKT